ncbi:hypothetical protein [Spiroplasma ixodetis]|uniref:hypothetical protein n=1 Tax=Spiroplasma ixodetis TaxID=2141 RepID=UPI002576E111|nr:hypothetical protein [Spiroplasma ixodetis]WJG70036.1 hypothetical protein SIXOD_v1c10670 [Spiroplasma ixodetis Y32]
MINTTHFICFIVHHYLPLNNKVIDTLKKTGKVYYEDNEAFSGLGLFILRFTLFPFWHKLEPVTQKLILELKKKNPDEFNTVYYGFEFLDSDATIFPFQKH